MKLPEMAEMKQEKKSWSEVRWTHIRIGAAALLALGLFFWKTNSWPVVAVVGMRPVFRFQVTQELFKQGGQQVLENLILEQIIRDELASKKIVVDEKLVTTKIDEIKQGVGGDENFKLALESQGMTEEQLLAQVKMQLGLEKLVGPATDSAASQEAVFNLLQELRAKAKVWVVK